MKGKVANCNSLKNSTGQREEIQGNGDPMVSQYA